MLLIIRISYNKIYMILDGVVNIEKDSYWGARIIVQKLGELNNIALCLVASKNIESTISAVCSKDATILTMNFNKCSTMCTNACNHHIALIQNMILSLALLNSAERKPGLSQRIKYDILSFKRAFKN